MKKPIKLKDLIEQDNKKVLKEDIFGKFVNLIWTITGTKYGLFKAIQAQYGEKADSAYQEISDATQALKKLKERLEKL